MPFFRCLSPDGLLVIDVAFAHSTQIFTSFRKNRLLAPVKRAQVATKLIAIQKMHSSGLTHQLQHLRQLGRMQRLAQQVVCAGTAGTNLVQP